MTTIAEDKSIRIQKYSLGPYGTNSYIVICRETGESAIIDAPGDAQKVKTALEGTVPRAIWMTHNHMDHTGALAELKSAFNIPIAAHPSDAPGLPVQPDIHLSDGQMLQVGKIAFKVIHAPGHTGGSVCFHYDRYLISGDTLFPGGPGKTWSPEGFRQIIASLSEKIFTLPGDTMVLPGHGEGTLIRTEKAAYEAFAAKGPDPGLCGDVSWK